MTIALGIFGTPVLLGMPQEVQDALAAVEPFPSRLGTPQDCVKMVMQIIEHHVPNGEVIRLDGAIRLTPSQWCRSRRQSPNHVRCPSRLHHPAAVLSTQTAR